MTPTPDPIKTIEELVTSVYHEAYKCGVGARPPHAYRSVEAVIKEATQAINNELLRAKTTELERLEFTVVKTMEALGEDNSATLSLKTLRTYIDLRKVELVAKSSGGVTPPIQQSQTEGGE